MGDNGFSRPNAARGPFLSSRNYLVTHHPPPPRVSTAVRVGEVTARRPRDLGLCGPRPFPLEGRHPKADPGGGPHGRLGRQRDATARQRHPEQSPMSLAEQAPLPLRLRVRRRGRAVALTVPAPTDRCLPGTACRQFALQPRSAGEPLPAKARQLAPPQSRQQSPAAVACGASHWVPRGSRGGLEKGGFAMGTPRGGRFIHCRRPDHDLPGGRRRSGRAALGEVCGFARTDGDMPGPHESRVEDAEPSAALFAPRYSCVVIQRGFGRATLGPNLPRAARMR